MKYKDEDMVECVSPCQGMIVGQQYKIAYASIHQKMYYFYDHYGAYIGVDCNDIESATKFIPPAKDWWNPYAPEFKFEAKKCTCGASSLGITEVARHSGYCDLQTNPKIGNWKWK
jgi:hypothetical protein